MAPGKVIKRDGTVVDFDKTRIVRAISRAAAECGYEEEMQNGIAEAETKRVLRRIKDKSEISVEEIQDVVEQCLMDKNQDIAKKYMLYRQKRSEIREKQTQLMKDMDQVLGCSAKEVDYLRENANINGETPMGGMLKSGSLVTVTYALNYMIPADISAAHRSGLIHVHDLDFYNWTTTCTQIDARAKLASGFHTGHGFIRPPSNIRTACSQICIIIQSNQNDQHGGQSIPALDYAMEPYVAKEFLRQAKFVEEAQLSGDAHNFSKLVKNYYNECGSIVDAKAQEYFTNARQPEVAALYLKALERTEYETYQACEAMLHNLNTMQSRAGSQTPFSSINYGTCTSGEARMFMKCLLEATDAGLGEGETPIFPIQIWKCKKGVSFYPGDPNYDLFQLACKVSAKRLFPNFSFMNSSFNSVPEKDDPNREVAYMGCRTRVFSNSYDKTRQVTFGRGNLSFTSINLPRIAIEAKGNIDAFFKMLDETQDLVFRQLYERYKVQASRKVRNFPFLMGQGIWIDSEKLDLDDTVGEVLKHGTLTTGFIGLAETLILLTGKHHGESEESQKLGLKIIEHMRKRCDDKTEETGMNYTLIASPAEGLSGTFTKKDKKKYGIIPGVTDKEYYTNSFHVPVYYNISVHKKLEIEGAYHKYCNGGHISYVELDGDPLQNLQAFEDIIHYMAECDCGYGSINHAVDHCTVCHYTGIIGDTCPRCGRKEYEAISQEKYIELQKKYNF